MSEVIERVARAICEDRTWPGAWKRANEVERAAWVRDARAAIAAYEAAVGNLINIDQVAISRAMAICGFGGAVLDAARIAEALHGLIPAAPSARIAALEEALQDAVLQIEYLHGKFQETGSGNAVVSRARAVLEGKK